VFKKRILTTQLLLDQGRADEDIAGFQQGFFVEPPVFDLAAGNDGQAKEADPLKGQDFAALFFPVRI
jgi:hypothetical protein